MRQYTLTTLLALLTVSSIAIAAADPAIPKVPAGHPRVYVRADDLPALRQKLATDEFKAAYARPDNQPVVDLPL